MLLPEGDVGGLLLWSLEMEIHVCVFQHKVVFSDSHLVFTRVKSQSCHQSDIRSLRQYEITP